MFRASNFNGEVSESEEMRPAWFSIDQIPFENMWSDDQYWMPMLLAGKRFKAKYYWSGYRAHRKDYEAG